MEVIRRGLAKSSATPIHCSVEDLQHTSEILSAMKDFPCTYLPWPPPYCSKADLLPLIDKDADHLSGWKASIMNKAGSPIYGPEWC